MSRKDQKRRILLVDDETPCLDLLRRQLSPSYDVFASSDGEALLPDMEAFRPDLVVLDVHMPGAGGFALCRRVRAHPRFSRTPVLFLTASREDFDFVQHLASQGSAYLVKPAAEKELISLIEELMAWAPARAGARRD